MSDEYIPPLPWGIQITTDHLRIGSVSPERPERVDETVFTMDFEEGVTNRDIEYACAKFIVTAVNNYPSLSVDVKLPDLPGQKMEVSEIIELALDKLIYEQPDLLELNVTERSLSHHLAFYIAELVPVDYVVDVEYNRHGSIPKRLSLPPRKALDRELRATTVFPEILVHKRNTNDHNLLVLELKKPGEDMKYDELKLQAFRKELGYQHAAHVIIGHDNGQVVRTVICVNDP